jgi:pentatricopeptide repeat protein
LGEGIHAEVRERGLLETDHVLGTALLDMYAKCGAVKKAAQVFEQLPVRNTVSWSAMISAYAQSGLGDEALHCFEQMQEEEGVRPNAVTYASVLKACSIVGSLSMGEHVYLTVRRQHMWEEEADVVLGTALVDMYSKCGDLEKAEEVFDEFPV